MKKSFPALLALAAALALGGCELFTSTVEYNVSGGTGATLYISVDGSVAASASLAASPTGEVFYIVD